jgi:hypothetical protein
MRFLVTDLGLEDLILGYPGWQRSNQRSAGGMRALTQRPSQ